MFDNFDFQVGNITRLEAKSLDVDRASALRHAPSPSWVGARNVDDVNYEINILEASFRLDG